MDWFAKFVDEVVAEYRRLRDEAVKVASFEEKLDVYLAEMRQEVDSSFIGDVGERSVELLLSKSGFTTARSPGSRSPADVWGAAHADGVTHVALVQVKTARKGRAPATLTDDEERALERFCRLVHGLFYKSPNVPADLKARPLVISAGYAGVVFDLYGMGPSEYDVRYVGAAQSRGTPGGQEAWDSQLTTFYGGFSTKQ